MTQLGITAFPNRSIASGRGVTAAAIAVMKPGTENNLLKPATMQIPPPPPIKKLPGRLIATGDVFPPMDRSLFFANSWCKFLFDPGLANWVRHILPTARQSRFENAHQQWLRCGETWFVGVNVLPNDTDGGIEGGPSLTGMAVDFLRDQLKVTPLEWEAAQVSIVYPGYPKSMTGESDAAFRFRRDKYAAHIDGILPEGDKHGGRVGVDEIRR